VNGHPWGRRILLGFCLGMLILLLLVDGFTTKTVGAAGTGTRSVAGSSLAGSAPVLVANGRGGLVSHQPAPGRRIALTFDDGPNPTWTPKIAVALLAAHVPATFFEVGSQVVRYPAMTRMLHRDGFELGNHTFTHADLSGLPGWEAKLQISLTESAISGITGVRPRLVRPPYSSTTEAVTSAEGRAWGAIAATGHLIALANYDTQDWERPGVSTIVSNVLSEPAVQRGIGGIVLMHDAGGDRSQTVAALPKLIAALRARGFRFATVSQMAGLSRSQVEVPASAAQRLRGSAFDAMLALAGFVTSWLTRVVMLVTILVGLRMLAALALARVQIRRVRDLPLEPSFAPAVSILVPAHNEAVGIERAVRSLAGSIYAGEIELIVVDDGSEQPAADALAGVDDQRLRVFRTRQNQGVSTARNVALRAARAPVVAQLDADDLWRPDHLEGALPAFDDPAVGMAYTNVEIIGTSLLDRAIAVRRPDDGLPRWVSDRAQHPVDDLQRLYSVNPIPAPGALMRTGAVRAVGGYPRWLSVGEEYFVYIKLKRAGWRIAYVDRMSAVYRWPEPGRGVSFDAKRGARENLKLFSVLMLSTPGEPAIRRRLIGELRNVVRTNVPGSVPVARAVSRAIGRSGADR
jgi:peptidoglycan-N-acetylglucosamine deacetylase